jgi:DNA-binding MarR family transcriptional regulator
VDYIEELGTLALASRLKRLLNRLHMDGEQVYRTLSLDFKTKWFPVLHLLAHHSPLTLTQMADALKQAHPSVIEVVDELIEKGLVSAQRCEEDRRRREISISSEGQLLCARLEPVWQAFKEAGDEVNREYNNDVLEALLKLERAMDRQPLFDRILARLEIHAKGGQKTVRAKDGK